MKSGNEKSTHKHVELLKDKLKDRTPESLNAVLNQSENGKLLSEEQIQWLKEKHAQKKEGEDPKIKKESGKIPFSVMFDKSGTPFAIFNDNPNAKDKDKKFKIGKGGFGTAKLGQNLDTGEFVVIKTEYFKVKPAAKKIVQNKGALANKPSSEKQQISRGVSEVFNAFMRDFNNKPQEDNFMDDLDLDSLGDSMELEEHEGVEIPPQEREYFKLLESFKKSGQISEKEIDRLLGYLNKQYDRATPPNQVKSTLIRAPALRNTFSSIGKHLETINPSSQKNRTKTTVDPKMAKRRQEKRKKQIQKEIEEKQQEHNLLKEGGAHKIEGDSVGLTRSEDIIVREGRKGIKSYSVQKLIKGSGLEGYTLNEKAKSLTYKDIKTIVSNLYQELHHMHNNQIIHRDIKPENILIDPDTLSVTIIDFGAAAKGKVENDLLTYKNATYMGTLMYLDPNTQKDSKNRFVFNETTDGFSAGRVSLELVRRWAQLNPDLASQENIPQNFYKGEMYNEFFTKNESPDQSNIETLNSDDPFFNVILGTIHSDPNKRISPHQAFEKMNPKPAATSVAEDTLMISEGFAQVVEPKRIRSPESPPPIKRPSFREQLKSSYSSKRSNKFESLLNMFKSGRSTQTEKQQKVLQKQKEGRLSKIKGIIGKRKKKN